jgi:alpha-beta hydrolase superfamily lysophospholipase
MVLGSPRLTALAGGPVEVEQMLGAIEDHWIEALGHQVHLDVHPSADPKGTIVFQPGSGAHGRLYFLLGGLLAARGYEFIAIDRPGHGLSDGVRGDCTVDEAIAAARSAVEYARSRSSRPVTLMGSSMGGLLTVFALLSGVQPDSAIVHNFVFPGKLFPMRVRAWWIANHRTNPYPLAELVSGFEDLSSDPATGRYLRERGDRYMSWELSPRSVASLFGFKAPSLSEAPDTLVLTGDKDRAIPAWITRLFMKWSGLPSYEIKVLPDAGHLLFHDHLDRTIPLVSDWMDGRIGTA